METCKLCAHFEPLSEPLAKTSTPGKCVCNTWPDPDIRVLYTDARIAVCDQFIYAVEILPKEKICRGRPKGSKNKPKQIEMGI
jgi:hypothetical protein